MAYKIVYGQVSGGVKRYDSVRNDKRIKKIRSIMSVIFCAVCCLGLIIELYRIINAPEKTEEVRYAFSALADNLQQGKSIGDAVSAFCEEIVRGGET